MKSYNNELAARAEKRRRQLAAFRDRGWSDAKIGRQFNITRQRVGQILGKKGQK